MIDAVIDISHHNGAGIDFRAVKASGILGVIHKASQGGTYEDPMYNENRIAAIAAGLRFGSYHFGTSDGAVDEASFYLETCEMRPGELMALDFEMNNAGSSMSLPQARAFVGEVHGKTGVWPMLYGGGYLKTILRGQADPLLVNCPLWLAAYTDKPTLPPGWRTWSMWQYTDGSAGPDAQETPGVGFCDRSRYIGTAEDFDLFWDSVSFGAPKNA